LLVYINENKQKIITALCSKFKLVKKNPNKIQTLKIMNIASIDVSSKSKLLIEARKVPVVDPDPNGEKEYDDAEQTRVAKREAEIEKEETKKAKAQPSKKGKEEAIEESEEEIEECVSTSETESETEISSSEEPIASVAPKSPPKCKPVKEYSSDESEDNTPAPIIKKPNPLIN
jgi:hypothetical protein